MQNQITINGIAIDTSKLPTKQALLEHLKEDGGTDRGLVELRSEQSELFGNELMWHYPITDGYHAGFVVVAVQEGFLCLPYHEIYKEDYEIFELDKAELLDADSLANYISEWESFSTDLLGALNDMLGVLKEAIT